MCVDGGAGESGEELEEPGDELGGQLLSLDTRLGCVDDPLVVLHILQQPKQTHKPSRTGNPAIACGVNKTLETQKPQKQKEWKLARKRTWDLSLASFRLSTYW
jgi:hypothetical protein